MSGEPITIPTDNLSKFMAAIAEQVAARLQGHLVAIPRYYKFPEDIVTMTGGHIPVGTIRSWKTAGYLRTFKIGRRTFVKPEDWQWFIDNHGELMAAAPNNLGAKMIEKKETCQ